METLVINSTEGGAYIKGCQHMPLKIVIDKYCKKPIDKTKLAQLCLTPAEDGDGLINQVIPLLQNDIDNLETIVKHARLGLAANTGLKNLISKWQRGYTKLLPKKLELKFNDILIQSRNDSGGEYIKTNHLYHERILDLINTAPRKKLRTIIKLSYRNFYHSEITHKAAEKNPLVNVAIFGASRKIQSRELKGKQTLINFLRSRKNALIRIERNNLILTTAKAAAESLKKSYVKTLKLLKEYDETKDINLLAPPIEEKINLEDSETYFKAGNWGHPLLDAQKVNALTHPVNEVKTAKEIQAKALELRSKAIAEAKAYEKENLEYETKLLEYNEILEKSRKIGRIEKDFDKALVLLKKAVALLPDKIEGRWGLASALHHSGSVQEALKEYEKLIKDFPDNLRFKFEYGQILLISNQIENGIKIINDLMTETNEFDSFLIRMGQIYQRTENLDKALIAFDKYTNKFPYDFNGWRLYGKCLKQAGENEKSEDAFKKANIIKPN
jgi:tetratricopeptide (TPR) repeat protein